MLGVLVAVLFSSVAWAAPLDGEFIDSSVKAGNSDDIVSLGGSNTPKSRARDDVGRSGWTASEGDEEEVNVFHGLLTNDVGLSVSNIEDVTGAVLVKSRIIEKEDNRKKRPGTRDHGETVADIPTGPAGKSFDEKEPEGTILEKQHRSAEADETVQRRSAEADERVQHRSAEADERVQHRSAEAFKRVDPTPGYRTRLLVTFVDPVQARTEAAKRSDAGREPTVLKILADESDIAFEYLAVENTKPTEHSPATEVATTLRTSLKDGQGEQTPVKDSVTPAIDGSDANISYRIRVDGNKKTDSGSISQHKAEEEKLGALIKSSVTVNLEGNDNLQNRSGKIDNNAVGSEQVDSKLISVRGPPPPSHDPEVIHLSQNVKDKVSAALNPSILIKTVTATVTETATRTDTKVTSLTEITTSTLTKTSTAVTTSTAVSTTVKTETSTLVLTPTPLIDLASTTMMMNWPTRNTFLSPMPSSSSSFVDTREALFSSSQPPTTMTVVPTTTTTTRVRQETSTSTVMPTTTTESTTLDPTSPDFFLPAVLRDVSTGTEPPLEPTTPSTPVADTNGTTIIKRITAILRDNESLGTNASSTENMRNVISMLRNMTLKGAVARNITDVIKTPDEVTAALQDLLKQIIESLNTSNTIENMTEMADIITLLENRNVAGQEEQNITQFLNHNNTRLAVWPSGGPVTRVAGDTQQTDKMANFTPTDNDPFRCRRPGVQYPLGIEYRELRARMDTGALLLIDVRNSSELEATGRLPWSYNLPLVDLQRAFKMSSSTFQAKYGFPKPSVSSPHVVLTSRAGRRVVAAWNILQQFGYCNVRLYYGSFLEWFGMGGSLIPYFGKVDEPTEKQKSSAANSAPKNHTSDSTTLDNNDTFIIPAASVLDSKDAIALDKDEGPSLLTSKNAPTLLESLLGTTDDSSQAETARTEAAAGIGGGSVVQTPSGTADGRRTNSHTTQPLAKDHSDRKPFQTSRHTDEIYSQIQYHLRDKVIVEDPAEYLRPAQDYDYTEYSSE